MLNNVSAEMSVEEARELGLQPCKICNPLNIYAGSVPSPRKAQGKQNTVQYLGYTQVGNRCKHMTSIGNGYCYQHQPR